MTPRHGGHSPPLRSGQRSANTAGRLFGLAWVAVRAALVWCTAHPRTTVVVGAFIAGALLAGPAGVLVVSAGMVLGAWWVCCSVPEAPGRLVRRFTVDPNEDHAHEPEPATPVAPGRPRAACQACGSGHQDRQVWLVGRSPITAEWQCVEVSPSPLTNGGSDVVR